MGACSKGEARLVLVGANCPESFLSDFYLLLIPEYQSIGSLMVNRQLGSACAKPFAVSSLCVVDPGQSDLLTLQHNL